MLSRTHVAPRPVILVAPASFKGTLSAREAAAAIARGARRACPGEEVVQLPVADGGEGTLDALGLPTRTVRVRGAWRARRDARVGVDGDAWVIELAQICGWPPGDAMTASTRGVGEALRIGLDAGVRRFRVCLGGSVTTDAGAGLLLGLGGALLDARGLPLMPGGDELRRLREVVLPDLHGARIDVACDVQARFLQAANVYARQKGASGVQVLLLEAGLRRFAEVTGLVDQPGAGAAGGTAAALLLLGATLHPGAAWVLDAVGFDAQLARARIVVTGEGRVDAQTAQGKAPMEVVRRAQARGVPVVMLAGAVEEAVAGVPTFALEPGGSAAAALEEAAARASRIKS